jgi:hypothetical protein
MKKLSPDELKALAAKHFPEPAQFPLWQFTTESGPVFTRGRTCEEAQEYIASCGMFTEVIPVDHTWVKALALYGSNHNPGWLTRPPAWLVLKLEGVQNPVEVSIAHQYPC